MKTLITGSKGKLGTELVSLIPNSLHPVSKELDITNRSSVFDFINHEQPNLIIHCAAITGIRECEEKKSLAWNVNVLGTENIVKACEEYQNDCYFVYVSTACVFRGDIGDYIETDIPYPKNFYALTKLLSEFIVNSSGITKKLVIRTNFVGREKWPYRKAFIDRFGTYLFADDLAKAMISVIAKGVTGTVHVCGEEKFSMFELAKITTPDILPMTLAEYEGPPLTVNMTLRSDRISPFKITK